MSEEQAVVFDTITYFIFSLITEQLGFWDMLSFIGGDVTYRYLFHLKYLDKITVLDDFPYGHIISRGIIIELFRVIYASFFSKDNSKISGIEVIHDFSGLLTSLSVSNALNINFSNITDENKCKHWYDNLGLCIFKDLPGIEGGINALNTAEDLAKISLRLSENAPLSIISFATFVVTSSYARGFIGEVSPDSVKSLAFTAPFLL